MKKSLSVAMVVAMVSSMFASMAFADDAATTTTTSTPTTAQEKFDALVKAGIFDADGSGNGADLNGLTTRAQIAKIVAKVYNLSDDAASASTFKDLDGSGWATGVIGAVAKAHLMEGRADGVFAPTANVKLEELAIILARAFKLDTTASTDVGSGNVDDWAKGAVAAALKAGLIPASTDFTKEAVRSDLATSAYAAVAKVAADKAQADAEAAAKQIDVASVSALSNTKVKVALNKELSATDKGQFAIVDSTKAAVAVSSASLSADKKAVYVNTAAMTPGAVYTLSVAGKDYTFVAQVANTTALSVGTASANNNVEVLVTFNANIDSSTALNAANYTIDNGLTVSGVTATAANQVTLMTSAQTAGQLYKLTVANVTDELGNALDTANAKNIVYFGGKAADTTAPTAAGSSDTNTRFKVTFTDSSDLDGGAVLNKDNYKIDGGLTVSGVAYDKNGDGTDNKKVVLVTTSAQVSGQLYTVTLNNIGDKFGNKMAADTKVYFGGKAADTAAPTATAASSSNTSFKVVFADASNIDATSALVAANYVVDGGLTVSAVKYDAPSKTATITTSTQTTGQLYKVTINNVKDEYGNVIAANTVSYFGGKAVDTTAPTYTAVATASNAVKVVFDDAIDSTSVLPYNFNIKGLGYALTAKLDTTADPTGKTVVLTTLGQTSGTIYTVEARNVKNTDGTVVASDSNTTFAGMASVSTDAPKLLGTVALDNQYVVLSFNKDLAVLPAVSIVNNDDTAFDGTANVAFYAGTKNKVIAKLATNGKKFTEGTLYKAVATNAIATNGVAISTTADFKTLFSGVGTDPVAPKQLSAVAVDNTTVTVYFDKPISVAGLTNSTVELWDTAATPANVKYGDNSNVTVQNKNLSSDGKQLTLYFKHATKTLTLTEGAVYQVRFTTPAQVTDSVNGTSIAADSTSVTYASAKFGAVSNAAAKPTVLAAVAQSKYVVDVTFNKAVAINGDVKSNFVIQPLADGKVLPTVKLAKVLDDTKKVRLFLDEAGAGVNGDLTDGTVYTLRYTPDGTNFISDIVDHTVTADIGTGTYKDVSFAAVGTVAKGPAVTGIANVNANTVNVTLDQVANNVSAANIVVKEGATDITANVSVAVASDKKSFKIVRTDGVFKAGTTYSVSLKAAVLDESSKRASDATVVTTFGGLGNADLKLVAAVDTTGTPTVINTTLTKNDGTAVNDKQLRVRTLSATATPTFDTDAIHVEAPSAGTNTVSVNVTNDNAGDQYVVEATDGSVAITVLR